MLAQLWNWISDAMTSWYRTKMFLEHASAFSSDAMHILAGMVILLVASVSRRPVTAWLPWLVVLTLTLMNEFVDLWIEQWPNLAMQYGESVKDLLLTMALPTLLLVAARLRPELFGPKVKR